MRYIIRNKRNYFLSAFHSNGGWEIKDVFPCSRKSWLVWKTEKEASAYLSRIKQECEEQRSRWMEWTDIAIKFVETLKVAKKDN